MASSLLNLASSPLNSLKSIPGSIGALTASQITPRLYLTDWVVAGNWAALSHLGITHVVSVVEVAPIIPGKIEHLHIFISDLPICNISDHFEQTTEFIHKALSKDDKAKVLVHCLGGLSRSASVVCAYLIAAKGLTAEEAIAYAHDCRRVTHPNAGFRKQLRDYAARYGLNEHDEEDAAAASTQKNGVLSGITSGITGRSLPGMKLLRTGSVRQMVKDGVSGILDGNSEVVKVARAKALGPDWQGAATIVTHTSAGPDATINVDVTQTVVQPDSSVQVTETHAVVQKDATISAETTSHTLPGFAGLSTLPAISKLGFKIPGLPGVDQLNSQFTTTQKTAGLQATALGLAHKPSVTQAVYTDLVHYFKFASTAYALTLPTLGRPNGQKLCGKMWDLFTDSHGYVARDDTRKEIIVAYRGSTTPMNFVTDALGMMVNWSPATASVDAPAGTQVHFGFQQAWRSVSDSTIKKVTAELGSHPSYSIVCTGHSLGGAMASLCAVSLQKIFPSTTVKMYTYGQPRTGNETYARWVEQIITKERIFRVVHSLDGVPTMAPRMLGFRHHGTEYWALSPPSSPANTLVCVGVDGEEDPEGSMKIPTTGINPPHLMYFGIFYMMPFLF